MATGTLSVAIDFTEVHCGEVGCDAIFAVPTSTYERWRKTHESWFCPKGHCRAYKGKTETERRIEELQRTVNLLQEQRTQLAQDVTIEREARLSVQRKLSRKKAEVTRVKNRIAGGVCPSCKRTFVSLQRHMKTQHPDYASDPESAVKP